MKTASELKLTFFGGYWFLFFISQLVLLSLGIFLGSPGISSWSLAHHFLARVKSSWFWYKATGISPGLGQCLYKRGLMDNVVSREECSMLRELMQWSNMTGQPVGDQLTGKNIYELAAEFRQFGHRDPEYERRWALFWDVRDRLQKLVQHHFNEPAAKIDYTHMTRRTPGIHQFSHGFHSDNCEYNWNTGDCPERPESCCAWRHFSLLMYLNDEAVDFHGGRFIFAKSRFSHQDDGCRYGLSADDMELYVQPKCGRAVFFKSNWENLHGVERIMEGTRYAFAEWLTTDPSHYEQDRDQLMSTTVSSES